MTIMNELLKALSRCLKISCVEDEVEMRVSEDEGVVESEDAAHPQPHHRAPSHNSEDYAHALAKYARVSHLYVPETHKDRKTRGREKDKYGTRGSPPEMTLRQFSSLPELLKKLREDLKISYLSFVKELVRDPHDGVTLLLEVLKMIQLAQTDLNGTASSKEQQAALRRALIDEHECLSCLRYCLRCTDATLKLAHYHHGLYTLAVATMSNLARSRTIALQLLTQACETSTAGHRQVVDALSTLRLRFAEPVRCKFLVSMMLSHPQPSFQVWGLKFVNALVTTSNTLKERIYLQEELTEAGFDSAALRKVIDRVGGDTRLQSIATAELDRWANSYIDVDKLDKTVMSLQDSNTVLQGELQKLREANMKLLEENVLLKTVGGEVEERLTALQRRLEVHGLPSAPSPAPSISDSDLSSLVTLRNTVQRNTSNSTCRSELASSPIRSNGSSSTIEGERPLSPEWTLAVLNNGKTESRSSSRESGQGSSRSQSEVSTPEPVFVRSRGDGSSSSLDNHSDDQKSLEIPTIDSSDNSRNGQFELNNEPISKQDFRKSSPIQDKFNEHMPTTHIDMTFSKSDKSEVPEYANGFHHEPKKSSRPNSRQRIASNYIEANGHNRLSSRSTGSGRSTPSSSNLDDIMINGKHSPAGSHESSTSKRKAPLPPPPPNNSSSFSSSSSSLSSASSAASLIGGERKDPQYENVSRLSNERARSRTGNEDGDLDYERDMVVYEAITLGNDTIFLDRNSPSQSNTLGKLKNKSENENNTDQCSDMPCVRQSVRHYENLSNDIKEVKKDEVKTDDMKYEEKKMETKTSGNKNNSRSIKDYKNDDVGEKEVEAVINGLENVLRNAESSLSLVSQETVKENAFVVEDKYEDRASPDHQVSEEIEIVPTRVPQLPSRSRSRDTPTENGPVDPVLFLDYESPTETSDTETLRRFNKAPSSPRTMETESTKSFGYMKAEHPVRRHETFMDRSNSIDSPREEPKRGIKRSESFQMGNKGEYNSHRSYSPRRRGSTDLLVPLEESEIYINGRTFTRYTPQEVERRNKVNEMITAELSRRKNRSLEDRLDQWFDNSNDEWTLRWKYPEIHRAAEEALSRRQGQFIENQLNNSPSKKDGRKSSKTNDNNKKNNKSKSSKNGQAPSKPSRSVKPNRYSNKDITAFSGFKNPSADIYESDYGPNFMLNKPGQRRSTNHTTNLPEYAKRDMRAIPGSRKSKEPREIWSGRRKLDPDPDIPTPDYTATPGSTLSNAVNGPAGKHILDMPSGLY